MFSRRGWGRHNLNAELPVLGGWWCHKCHVCSSSGREYSSVCTVYAMYQIFKQINYEIFSVNSKKSFNCATLSTRVFYGFFFCAVSVWKKFLICLLHYPGSPLSFVVSLWCINQWKFIHFSWPYVVDCSSPPISNKLARPLSTHHMPVICCKVSLFGGPKVVFETKEQEC